MDNKYLDINGLDYFKNKFERKLESKMNTVGVVHIINKNELSDNQAYRIAKFDLSKFAETDFGGNYSPEICVQLLSWKFGYQRLFIRPLWLNSLKRILLVVGTSHIETNSNTMINNNIEDVFNFSKIDDNTIGIYYSPSTLLIAEEDAVKIISYTVYGVKTYEPEDNIVVDWTCVKESIDSLQLSEFSNYKLDFNRIFTPNDDSWIGANGVVPHPTTSEAENKYLLGADAKWHPRKAGNEYIANLKPTEEIKGLSETDTTKGISFVTIDFNSLSQKIVEAAPSTLQEFMIHMKVLTRDLGIITISTSLSVTTAGLIACSGVLSDRGMGSDTVSFSTTYSGKLGAVVTPGFFVNDMDTKIFKIALYTPIAIDGVKIIDADVTSYSDIIDEGDITFTWELGILEKKPPQVLRSDIIYPRIDLDRELVFDQMNIETPISETDEDTLFAEQIKHNGLVPAPTKYEADQGYVLHADGTWKKVDGNASFTPVPITLDSTKYQEAYETQSNPDSSKKTVLFMNIDLSDFVITGSDVARIELSLYSVIYGRSTLVIDTMINAISNQYCVSEDANGSGYYLDYMLSALQKNPSFTGKDGVSIESFYTFMIDGDIIRIGISPIIFSIYGGTVPPFAAIVIEDCKIIRQSVTSNSVTTEMGSISINYDQTTNTLSNIYGANRKGWVAKNTVFSDYSDADPRDFQSLHNGLVPAPTKEEAGENKFLKADGTWGYQRPPIIECSSIENSENLILTSEGEEILEELLSTPCFNFAIKLHGLSTDTFTATSQFAIAKNDRYIKLYDAATSEAIVVLKGGSYVYVTIIKVSENIYHGMCIRHNYNVDETNK